jgi:hypothetical protein
MLALTGAGPESAAGAALADPALPAISTGVVQAHFKANNGPSTSTDGAAVSQWNDQSGNARHASQATGSKQPIYKAGILNGYPAIRFDGIDDFLQTAGFTLNQPDTWLFVVRFNAVYAANSVGLDGVGTALVHDHGRTSNTQLAMFNAAVVNAPAATTTNFNYFTALWNTGTSVFRANGVSGTSGSVGTGNAGGVTIGGDATGAQVSGIDVPELIVCSGNLNATDYGALELYVKNKYAL